MTKSILITGDSGFIGSYLSPFFAKNGFSLLGKGVDDSFPEKSVDYVIHCASQQPRPQLDFGDYSKGNVDSLIQTLDWMKEKGIKKIISFSSATVYADADGDTLFEGSRLDPCSDYAISKLAADQILKVRSEQDRLTSICFRMPSVFGPKQEGGIVQTYYNFANKNVDFDIFSEGKLKRNLLYIEEIGQVCEKGIRSFDSLDGFNLYLLGSSNSLTMEEIARKMVACTGSRSKIVLSKKKAPVEINWVFCLDKLKKELAFVPQTIESGLLRYVKEMKG